MTLFFLFEMDQIVLGNLPNDKRNAKNFASGLIVPGDLPNDWKIRGFFFVMVYCNGLPAQNKVVYCNGLPAQMVTL